MFSKVLIKLVDEAIVPAVFLITVRIVSLVLLSQYLDIPFKMGSNGFVFYSYNDYVLVNTYSVLYMMLALCLGLLHVVIKSTVFHDTHISPPLAAKLYSLKVHHLIQDTFHLYTQGLIWLAYLYCLTVGAGLMTLFGILHSWIAYVSLALAVLYTYIFIVDAEKEILVKLEKRK